MNQFKGKKPSNATVWIIQLAEKFDLTNEKLKLKSGPGSLIDRSSSPSQFLQTDLRSFAFNIQMLNFTY